MKIRKSIKLLPLLSTTILPITLVSCAQTIDPNLSKAYQEKKFFNLKPRIVLSDNESDGVIQALEKSIDKFVQAENNVENTNFQRPESKLWFKYYNDKDPDRDEKNKKELDDNIKSDLKKYNIFFIQDDFDYSKFRAWLFDQLPNTTPLWKDELHKSLFFPINPDINNIASVLWDQIADTQEFVAPIFIKSQDPNWIAGYASAAYLASKYPKDDFRRKISFILNSKHKNQTNNLVGFLAGVATWNDQHQDQMVKINNRNDQIFIYSPGDNEATIKNKIKEIVNPENSQYRSELIFVASPDLNNFVSKELTQDQKVIYNDFSDNNLNSLMTIKQDLNQFIYDLLSDIYTQKKGTPESKILKSNQGSQQIFMHLLLNYDKAKDKDNLNSKYFKFKANKEFEPFLNQAKQQYLKEPVQQDISVSDSSLSPQGTAKQINETDQAKIQSRIQEILKNLQS